VRVRPLEPGEHDALARMWTERWGSTRVVSRGRVHEATELPGLVAERDGRVVGAATYDVRGDECELVTLDAFEERIGAGTSLIEAVDAEARRQGCRRLWLITTNDNLPALRFYQRRGFTLAALHAGALAESRRLKPEIPEIGLDGIPLRDELELERDLA
jgi:ribosomal protein S18 acetylase RimI-like enzyme